MMPKPQKIRSNLQAICLAVMVGLTINGPVLFAEDYALDSIERELQADAVSPSVPRNISNGSGDALGGISSKGALSAMLSEGLPDSERERPSVGALSTTTSMPLFGSQRELSSGLERALPANALSSKSVRYLAILNQISPSFSAALAQGVSTAQQANTQTVLSYGVVQQDLQRRGTSGEVMISILEGCFQEARARGLSDTDAINQCRMDSDLTVGNTADPSGVKLAASMSSDHPLKNDQFGDKDALCVTDMLMSQESKSAGWEDKRDSRIAASNRELKQEFVQYFGDVCVRLKTEQATNGVPNIALETVYIKPPLDPVTGARGVSRKYLHSVRRFYDMTLGMIRGRCECHNQSTNASNDDIWGGSPLCGSSTTSGDDNFVFWGNSAPKFQEKLDLLSISGYGFKRFGKDIGEWLWRYSTTYPALADKTAAKNLLEGTPKVSGGTYRCDLLADTGEWGYGRLFSTNTGEAINETPKPAQLIHLYADARAKAHLFEIAKRVVSRLSRFSSSENASRYTAAVQLVSRRFSNDVGESIERYLMEVKQKFDYLEQWAKADLSGSRLGTLGDSKRESSSAFNQVN